jgi:molybdenum cofactor cytidylyltransferase
MEKEAGYGIIILAGGNSSRLGRPKQLLLYEGETLLQHCINVSTAMLTGPVVAVLGANADLLEHEVNDNRVKWVINPAWQEGMATSIRCGLEDLLARFPALAAVIVMVCDQPFVSASLLRELTDAYEKSKKQIVAASYAGTIGTPALFDQSMFQSLLALEGDAGAKKLMKENAGFLATVAFPMGTLDIDTEADYAALLQQTANHL